MTHVISSLTIWGFFIFFIYLFFISIQFLNALYKAYPKEATDYFGEKRIFGTNQKVGIFLLWDDKVKDLTKKNTKMESLRKKCIRFFWIFLILLFFLPLIDILGWAFF